MTAYKIVDPRPTRAANPHSFYLPCDERLAAIAAGDQVKAIFKRSQEDEDAERMWVKITHCDGDTLTGTLANAPLYMPALAYGDTIVLTRTDVIDIETDRADDPAETNDVDDTLFYRCTMDTRVYSDKIQPVRIVRDAAQPESYGPENGDTYPWGGWRILGEGYDDGMPTEIATPIIAVRIDVSMVPLFTAPEGAAFDLVDGVWTRTA